MLKNPRSECMICGKDISASNYWGGYVTHYNNSYSLQPTGDRLFTFCESCVSKFTTSRREHRLKEGTIYESN